MGGERRRVPPAGEIDAELPVDAQAAAFLGDWFGFAYSVLEELRAERESPDANRVQLWPEHFDAAFDGLPDDRRATFGASPGDATSEQPYLYVIPANFANAPASSLWNAQGFDGAALPLSQFIDAPDQRATALTFLRQCRDTLREPGREVVRRVFPVRAEEYGAAKLAAATQAARRRRGQMAVPSIAVVSRT